MVAEQNKFFNNIDDSLIKQCLNINLDINKSLTRNHLVENEISFDHLIPFLFDEIPKNEAYNIAKELVLHRHIVDLYNKRINNIEELITIIEKNNYVKPVSYSEYQLINNKNRMLINDDISYSYLISTKRVYYRFHILEKLIINTITKKNIINKVRNFSAFLLFDDDVYDLELDINNNKTTILLEYLLKGNSITMAINKMKHLIPEGKSKFENFTSIFKNVYNYE